MTQWVPLHASVHLKAGTLPGNCTYGSSIKSHRARSVSRKLFSTDSAFTLRCVSMAGRFSLTQVLIILKFVHCRVDPPQDLAISDPGHLGNLEIRWSPFQEHIWMKKQCSVLYELHYHDSYSSSWTSVRTSQTSFKAQFDLTQEVKVCVYTLISGECMGGSTAKSKNCTEVIQKPDTAGVNGLQDLTCVYFNMEHMVCRWKRGSQMPAQSQEALHYWHRDLAQAKECPCYIISEGFRSGCNFSGTELPTFSNINLCVNASSARPVRALYSSLQIQNIVKPKATGEVHVEAGADGQLRVLWDSPTGKIPQHCLKWEVQERRESHDGKQTLQQVISTETAVTLALPDNETSCLSVRSMLNKYCAKSGLWSDWSPPVCYPEEKQLASASRRDMLPQHMYIAVIFVAALVLGLCVWAAVTLGLARQVKIKDSSLCRLFDKSSEQFLPVIQRV